MKFYGQTDKGKVRKDNQDCFAVEKLNNGFVVAVVCDGMGGANAGSIASETASTAFMKFMLSALTENPEADIAVLVVDAVSAANSAVYEKSITDDSFKGMGTTLVGTVVCENEAFVFNVGDSRCYHKNTEGLKKVTRDHSYVEELVQIGEITEEQARVHPRKNLITRALGIAPKVQCDVFSINLKPRDRILLCTDGLSNLFTDDELFAQCRARREPRTLCHALVKTALSRGAPDNVTVVVVEM